MSDLTVADVLAHATATLDVAVRPTTVDGIAAGDPSAVVRGVAVTTLATLEVLERAVEAGANVVVTHEPLYYDHLGARPRRLAAARRLARPPARRHRRGRRPCARVSDDVAQHAPHVPITFLPALDACSPPA